MAKKLKNLNESNIRDLISKYVAIVDILSSDEEYDNCGSLIIVEVYNEVTKDLEKLIN